MAKFFKPEEIKGLQPSLVEMLDRLRDEAGVPLIINSGFRSEAKNAMVGGVPDSAHTTGLACDLACTDGLSRWKIVNAALAVGFDRVGIANTFIHVDIDKSKPHPRIWLYE